MSAKTNIEKYKNEVVKITYQDDHKEFGFNPMHMTTEKDGQKGFHALVGFRIETLVPKVRSEIIESDMVTVGVDYGAMGAIGDDFVFIFHMEKVDGEQKIYYDFIPYSTETGDFLTLVVDAKDSLVKLGEKLARQFSSLDSEYVGDSNA